jgi:hypothetical protein
MLHRMLRGTCLARFFGIGLLALVAACSQPAAKIDQLEATNDEELRERLDKALDFTFANRHLNTNDQAAWQIVHGTLAFGRDFKIYHDGKLVPALDYLLAGGQLRGWTMRKGDHGLTAILEAGSKTGQGHEDQWLGYLSSRLSWPVRPIIFAI